jgi:hypothetical protein
MISLRLTRAALLAVAATFALGSLASAQDEAALKNAFEQQRVTIRIDMPGSADGVDVRVQTGVVSNISMDLQRYRNDLKRYGTSIRAGDTAMVTLVRIKKDLIEFQLDGGGFGTFGDNTSTSSNIQLIDKSEREKTLERQLKTEKDTERRRSMQAELDRLRDRREFENRRIQAERERDEAFKRERVAADRLRGGSRFNIRYKERVPPGIHAEDIRTALGEYVDFKGAAPAAVNLPALEPQPSRVRKGMLRADAEKMFGRPEKSSQKSLGEFTVVTLVFLSGEQRITADFIEDVLVRYSIASK